MQKLLQRLSLAALTTKAVLSVSLTALSTLPLTAWDFIHAKCLTWGWQGGYFCHPQGYLLFLLWKHYRVQNFTFTPPPHLATLAPPWWLARRVVRFSGNCGGASNARLHCPNICGGLPIVGAALWLTLTHWKCIAPSVPSLLQWPALIFHPLHAAVETVLVGRHWVWPPTLGVHAGALSKWWGAWCELTIAFPLQFLIWLVVPLTATVVNANGRRLRSLLPCLLPQRTITNSFDVDLNAIWQTTAEGTQEKRRDHNITKKRSQVHNITVSRASSNRKRKKEIYARHFTLS